MEEKEIRHRLRKMSKEIKAKIKQRRRQLIVHSYIYYILDDNIVDDATWSRWAKELIDIQNRYPVESSEVEYSEIFKEFDGSTGMHLPFKEPWVPIVANRLLNSRQFAK